MARSDNDQPEMWGEWEVSPCEECGVGLAFTHMTPEGVETFATSMDPDDAEAFGTALVNAANDIREHWNAEGT